MERVPGFDEMLDLGPTARLINALAPPVYTWRLWSALNHKGREKALRNAAAKIDAAVRAYVEERAEH